MLKWLNAVAYIKKASSNVTTGARTSESMKALIEAWRSTATCEEGNTTPRAKAPLPVQAAGAEESALKPAAHVPAKKALKIRISEPDPDAIAAMYGAPPAKKQKGNVLEISSEEEVQTTTPGTVWWSNADRCLVKQCGDKQVHAKMQEGPEGFAVAVWPDGNQEVSEHANLELQGPACTGPIRKPARPLKRPAAAPVAVAAASGAAEGALPATGQAPAALPATGQAPAALPATGTGPKKHAVIIAGNAWERSESFGWLKLTKATAKSYIVCKENWGDKPTCLVNVMGSSCFDHKAVAEELLEFAKGPGLDKDLVVAERNGIISR